MTPWSFVSDTLQKDRLLEHDTPRSFVGDPLQKDPLSVYDTDGPLLVTHFKRISGILTSIVGPLQKDPLLVHDTQILC
jgi:hypothetical protein